MSQHVLIDKYLIDRYRRIAGKVLAEVSTGTFLVEYYDWETGNPDFQALTETRQMGNFRVLESASFASAKAGV